MSVDQLKKFLDSTKDYPDTLPVRIGDAEVPLGSLRALNATDRNTLAERLKGIESKETELNTRQQAIVDLAKKAQAAYEAAEDARKAATATSTNTNTNTNDPFADPWLQPVKSALDARDKKIDELTTQLKAAMGQITGAAKVWAEDRWDREYSSINFGKREKKPTREELLKFAQENNLVDRHKMPSISAAWERMSEADRIEDIKREATEKGIEEGYMRAVSGRVTPPGTSGPGQTLPQPKRITPDTDVLGDLYAESLKDPELRQMIESLGPGVM